MCMTKLLEIVTQETLSKTSTLYLSAITRCTALLMESPWKSNILLFFVSCSFQSFSIYYKVLYGFKIQLFLYGSYLERFWSYSTFWSQNNPNLNTNSTQGCKKLPTNQYPSERTRINLQNFQGAVCFRLYPAILWSNQNRMVHGKRLWIFYIVYFLSYRIH